MVLQCNCVITCISILDYFYLYKKMMPFDVLRVILWNLFHKITLPPIHGIKPHRFTLCTYGAYPLYLPHFSSIYVIKQPSCMGQFLRTDSGFSGSLLGHCLTPQWRRPAPEHAGAAVHQGRTGALFRKISVVFPYSHDNP